jgi:serine/threonine protein kinase
VVDQAPGRHPILIVWDHRSWCPMACKVFASLEKAQAEARILSTLNHPNIVRLFEVGADAELFIEFVDGATLADLMDRHEEGRFRISDALRIAIHVGAALEHMHGRGFVHLDLAPSNIILRRDGRPVLVDFGAARLEGEERPPRVVGTDPYIAPEECAQQEVSRPANVFSFGVLLFELLTGELPFPHGTPGDPFPQTRREPARLRPFGRECRKASTIWSRPASRGMRPRARFSPTCCPPCTITSAAVRACGPPDFDRSAGGKALNKRAPRRARRKCRTLTRVQALGEIAALSLAYG